MAHGVLERRVEAARRFNRFYTRRIGVLHDGVYDSSFSLTQRTRSPRDGRQSHLALTAHGRKVFAPLNARSHDDVAAMLGGLSPAAQARATEAMQTIEQLLGDPPAAPAVRASYVLREPRPGDLGWVVHRHGAVYALEYGYDQTFEALVAEIVAHFVRSYDPKRERCWIAEQNGEIVGCVFLVKQSRTVAKLRLLLVEPQARGAGLGSRLVAECVQFAREAGYRTLTLWTQSELLAARRLYAAAGFRVVRKDRNRSFGKALVSETWELKL